MVFKEDRGDSGFGIVGKKENEYGSVAGEL
jgi:hypothetical protein